MRTLRLRLLGHEGAPAAKAEISRALVMSVDSTMNPLTLRPSANRMLPIESGGGIAATNLPNAAAGSAQISSVIEAPVPAATRSMPGLAGVVSSA